MSVVGPRGDSKLRRKPDPPPPPPGPAWDWQSRQHTEVKLANLTRRVEDLEEELREQYVQDDTLLQDLKTLKEELLVEMHDTIKEEIEAAQLSSPTSSH